MEDIHPRGGGARGRSVLECGRSKELRKKKACCFLNQTTKDEEKLWAVEKWKSKSRIPTFPPPRMPAAQGKKRRLHKTLDAVAQLIEPTRTLSVSTHESDNRFLE